LTRMVYYIKLPYLREPVNKRWGSSEAGNSEKYPEYLTFLSNFSRYTAFLRFCFVYPVMAIASISMDEPRGIRETSIVERAGGSFGKYSL